MGNTLAPPSWAVSSHSPTRIRHRSDLSEDSHVDPCFIDWQADHSLKRAITFLSKFGWSATESNNFFKQRIEHATCDVLSVKNLSEINCGPHPNSLTGSIGCMLIAGFDKSSRKPCQDRLICKSFHGILLLGILDGHGPFGDDAAQFVSRKLPEIMARHLRKIDGGIESLSTDHLTKFISKCFRETETALKRFAAAQPESISCNRMNGKNVNQNFNQGKCRSRVSLEYSGTTCSIALIALADPKKIVTAHIGDSRVVLGCVSTSGVAGKAVALTTDHNWKDGYEVKRAESLNGVVECFKDHMGTPLGPPRLYSKQGRSDGPGLAVSRSFGDAAGHRLGVSSVPDISVLSDRNTTTENVLVLASDGVWDVMSGSMLMDRFGMDSDMDMELTEEAMEGIAKECSMRWIYERKGICDDISMIVLKLG